MVQWERLTVSDNPPIATWDGTPIPLPVTQTRMLWQIARYGRASYQLLTRIAVGSDADDRTLFSQMNVLRRHIEGFGFTTEAIRNWGYRLILTEGEPR
jgi:DNA-binding response OmpR family regulator